jgi:hypothetical protein
VYRSILFAASVVSLAFYSNIASAQSHPDCPDDSYFTVQSDNGVRYGWFEDATCIVPINTHPECPDESYFTVLGDNGVSYGWYDDATCIVVPSGHPECPDESYFTVTGENGTHYGWYNEETCVLTTLVPDIEPTDTEPTDPEPTDTETTDTEPRQEFDRQSYRAYFTLVRDDPDNEGEEEGLNGNIFFSACVAQDGQFRSYDYSGDNESLKFDAEAMTYSTSSNLFFSNDIPTVITTALNELGEPGETCKLTVSFGLTVSSTYDLNNIPEGIDPPEIVRVDPTVFSGEVTGDCNDDFKGFRVESGLDVATKLGGNSPGEGGATEECLFLGVDPLLE